MFLWILNAILWSIWGIVYKKSLMAMDWVISNKLYQFIWAFFTILFTWILYLYYDFESVDLFIFFLLFLTAILWIFWELFSQYAYKKEKISVLVPYEEFESIFTVGFWFILFSDNSLISFVFTIFAWITLVIWSIDFKNFSFNKYCLALIVSSLFSTSQILLYWYILIKISEFNVFFYNIIMVFFILLVISIFNKEIYKIWKINIFKYKYIFLENFIRFIIWIFSLFIISELWIIQAVLIWMLFMITSMLSAYFFLKEKISKKEIIVAVIVSLCIWGGVFLW